MSTGTTLPGSSSPTATQGREAPATVGAPRSFGAPVVVAPAPYPKARVHRSWSEVLDRVRESTRANAVIAMDDVGLVIGSAGSLTIEEGDELAAHIGRAFDLLNGLKKIGGKAESVSVMYSPEGTWLTATRFSAPSGRRVTIGIVGPYTLIRQDRQRIRNAFFKIFDADELSVPPAKAEGDPS